MNIGGLSNELSHWVKHQLLVFTLGICICDGIGQDSGYGHEESHFMHDMKKFHIGLHFLNGMWFDVFMPLHVHLGRE